MTVVGISGRGAAGRSAMFRLGGIGGGRTDGVGAAREDGRPGRDGGAELDELRDFYEQYIAAFNARDVDAFAGFFHLPVTILPLADDDRHRGRPPVVVTEMAHLWPTLPATWTRSTIDEMRVVADPAAFSPRDG